MLTLLGKKVLRKMCGRWNDKMIGRIWEVLTEEFIDYINHFLVLS
jgi:hypothetical protein